jgi:hypothetical protein
LRDRSDEQGNQTFGFYDTGYKPRLSAHYLHNMTTILADTISTTAPKQLTYTISPGRPETVHELLLQKEDGTLLLVIWSEKYARGATADEITLTFDQTFSKINVYNPAQYTAGDPAIGERPLASYSNVNAIDLAMLNHPFIIEFDPPATSGTNSPRAAKETTVFPNPVKDVAYIQGAATSKAVEVMDLSGRIVLSVVNSKSVDISGLTRGTYLFRITTTDNAVENHKIVKQ